LRRRCISPSKQPISEVRSPLQITVVNFLDGMIAYSESRTGTDVTTIKPHAALNKQTNRGKIKSPRRSAFSTWIAMRETFAQEQHEINRSRIPSSAASNMRSSMPLS
jgi:hypothetical protein